MKTLRLRIRFFAGLFLALSVSIAAPGFTEEVHVTAIGYYLDIPEGWQLEDAENPALISFTDPSRKAVFQVAAFKADSCASVREAQAAYKTQIQAQGEESDFTYQGQAAVIADYSFKPGGIAVRGWFVFLAGENKYFAVSAFCEASLFDAYNDLLLSCIDSFAPGEAERLYPGPISQFFHTFQPEKGGSASARITLGNESFTLTASPEEVEANTVVIEREARVLAPMAGSPQQDAAWRRSYRMIFRDSYMRLAPAAKGIGPLLAKTAPNTADKPGALLSWFQGFSYNRTGTLSDFQSPLDCILTSTGDCDSLGMAYIILLKHLGYDAILLVSEKYSHAMAAVDIPGDGARFTFENKAYLVAELTRQVAIGRISRDMADPAFWLPVALGSPVKE
ncbi:MAG: hypothetical protein FWG35_06845 [Spirochaetaceae bacterium]|nr:hypothetical protein [Spirochaetaceae bacterium]